MARQDRKDAPGSAKTGLAGVGVAAFVVVCCAGAPLLFALLGGPTLATILGAGAGAGAAGLATIGVAVVIVLMRRHRRGCGIEPPARRTLPDHNA